MVVSVCRVVLGNSPSAEEVKEELVYEKDWKVDFWFDILTLAVLFERVLCFLY